MVLHPAGLMATGPGACYWPATGPALAQACYWPATGPALAQGPATGMLLALPSPWACYWPASGPALAQGPATGPALPRGLQLVLPCYSYRGLLLAQHWARLFVCLYGPNTAPGPAIGLLLASSYSQ